MKYAIMLLTTNYLHPMKLRYTLPLLFLFFAPTLFAQEETITTEPVAIPKAAPDPNEPLVIVEEMPSFPGGQEALMKYLAEHMKYPEKAAENGIYGTVYVTFVVEKDGSISNPKIIRGIGYGCDEEAWRVVKGMPNWTPGKQRGKEVRVQYNLPIRFKLT